MSRARTVPEAGDVPVAIVAQRMGFGTDTRAFLLTLERLYARGFPQPDPDTGMFPIEAVDRWRQLRHPHLFPELTIARQAKDARAVMAARAARGQGAG